MLHDRAVKLEGAFEPVLPADVTAKKKGVLPVHNDKLWMKHAEREIKDAFDFQVQAL